MSLTALSLTRVHTRVVTLPGVDGKARRIVLRFRYNAGSAAWQFAAAPAGRRKDSLRWRPLTAVLQDAFGLDFGERQLGLQEAARE